MQGRVQVRTSCWEDAVTHRASLTLCAEVQPPASLLFSCTVNLLLMLLRKIPASRRALSKNCYRLSELSGHPSPRISSTAAARGLSSSHLKLIHTEGDAETEDISAAQTNLLGFVFPKERKVISLLIRWTSSSRWVYLQTLRLIVGLQLWRYLHIHHPQCFT